MNGSQVSGSGSVGVTCKVVQPLKKAWKETKPKQMRLLPGNRKRLGLTFGKCFIAEELGTIRPSPLLADVT